jgi:hypothetical protein
MPIEETPRYLSSETTTCRATYLALASPQLPPYTFLPLIQAGTRKHFPEDQEPGHFQGARRKRSLHPMDTGWTSMPEAAGRTRRIDRGRLSEAKTSPSPHGKVYAFLDLVRNRGPPTPTPPSSQLVRQRHKRTRSRYTTLDPLDRNNAQQGTSCDRSALRESHPGKTSPLQPRSI